MHLDNVGGKVIVIGDVMLDRYVCGEAWRISPEAPVPVVAVNSRTSTLGGAGNVALNLKGLTCKVWLFGARGDDNPGREIRDILKTHRINDRMAVDLSLPTTTKTRVMANNQQLVRFDDEGKFNGHSGRYDILFSNFIEVVTEHDIKAVILSDYNKGVLSGELVSKVIRHCNSHDIAILVDPKRGDWEIYRRATVIKPNLSELHEASGYKPREIDDVIGTARGMLRRYDLRAVLVTMGAQGSVLVKERHDQVFPTAAKEVFDVSGAGDTVIATLAACMCSGYSLPDAARIANRAAGVVVGKLGTQPIRLEELGK